MPAGVMSPNASPASDADRHRQAGTVAIGSVALLEPTNLLLLACALIYGLIGDGFDALVLLGFVGFITLLDGLQQRRSARALAALAALSAPRAGCVEAGKTSKSPPTRWWWAIGCCWTRATGWRPMGW